MSYSADLAASLSSSLSRLSPALTSSSSPSSSYADLSAQYSPDRDASQEDIDQREHELRTLLTKLRPTSHSSSSGLIKPHPAANLSPAELAQLVDSAFVPFQGQAAVPLSAQTETVELVALAQLTIATYGVVLRILMDEAGKLSEMDEYWNRLESEAWRTSLYLVQSTLCFSPPFPSFPF
jgi:hypothetical protein